MSNLGGGLVYLFVVFGAPALLSRYVIGGEWRQVGASYALWLGLLFMAFFLPKGGTLAEKGGWMAIMAMFLTIFVVPVLTLIQRLLGGFLNRIS